MNATIQLLHPPFPFFPTRAGLPPPIPRKPLPSHTRPTYMRSPSTLPPDRRLPPFVTPHCPYSCFARNKHTFGRVETANIKPSSDCARGELALYDTAISRILSPPCIS